MKFTNLGRTDLRVSRLCLGTMTFGWPADERTSFAIMDRACDAGINFLDTADIYSSWVEGHRGGESETIIGRWLKGKARDRLVIATKVRGQMWEGADGEGLSAAHITRAIEDSLRRLQTDYVDLYQTHWPDENTPLTETAAALDTLVQSGKVRYLGCSNYPAELLRAANQVSSENGLARFDCLQPNYSLLKRREFEEKLEALCRSDEIGVIPYSPLAAGFLTGKYTRANRQPDSTRLSNRLIQRLSNDDDAYKALDCLREIATHHDAPISQIALAWLLARPHIHAPIIGARTLAQLEASLGATDITLSDAEITRLNELTAAY